MLQHLEIIIWPGFGAETWQGNTLVLRPDKAIPFVGSVDSWTDMTNEFPMVSIFGQCQPKALPRLARAVNSCLLAGISTIDLTHSPNDSWVAMQRVGGFEIDSRFWSHSPTASRPMRWILEQQPVPDKANACLIRRTIVSLNGSHLWSLLCTRLAPATIHFQSHCQCSQLCGRSSVLCTFQGPGTLTNAVYGQVGKLQAVSLSGDHEAR